MIIPIKILTGLSTEVVKMREIRNKNKTNRNILAYALYTWLKNKTTAGVIHHYDKQLETLLEGSNISRSSFYRYLNYAEDLKLITRNTYTGTLKLAGYASVMENLYIIEKAFTTIYYDTDKHKLNFIFETLEIHENKARQLTAVNGKISKNPIVNSAFKLFWISQGVPDQAYTLDNLLKTQKLIFEKGTAARIYQPLMEIVNPHFNRSSYGIAAAHGYLRARNTTYLKRKLVKRNLINVLDIEAPVCRYRKDRIEGNIRGKNENAFTTWNKAKNAAEWKQPQQIIINHFLFTPPL